MLDDLELVHVQEITTLDHRMLAEHRAPGMDGSYLQNLGRRPVWIGLWGVAAGPDALAFIEKLNNLFRVGDPIPFIADITQDMELEKVIIDDLQTQDIAGMPERYSYVLTLREFIEPVEPASTAAVDADILGDVVPDMDSLIEGLDLAPFFESGLDRFVEPLTGLLQRLQNFNRSVNGS
jgi:hypothetical protein